MADSDCELRRQLVALARDKNRRINEFSRAMPVDWRPHQVHNPETGMPFTAAGAWHFIADLLDKGHAWREVELEKPVGVFGYEMEVETGADSLLYIQDSFAPGFHFWPKLPLQLQKAAGKGRTTMKPEKAAEIVALDCPMCGHRDVSTTLEDETFDYGVEPNAVTLSAVVPVRTCASCGYQFTDAAAEEKRHESVCRHLKVMAPAEVVRLRKRHGLSRAEFGGLTRIGEASLARWETGMLVQNAGYDSLLYLLTFPENAERLKSRFGAKPVEAADLSTVEQRKARFPAVSQRMELLVAQASQWQLSPGAPTA